MKLSRALGILIVVFGFSLSLSAQQTSTTKPEAATSYDAELAKRTGADEHGMKTYVLAILKRSGKVIDKATRDTLLAGHLQNIGRLADSGKLLLAGPFADDGDMRGIFIFDVTTVEEAQKLVATDPSIAGGLFVVDMHPWYGSAALMEIPRLHRSLEKQSLTH